MNAYAIILAGGNGERFWPLSTPEHPKQFLDLFGGKPLICQAVERLQGLMEVEQIFVITSDHLAGLTREVLPQLPVANIIGEPCRRDTAAAVATACGIVKKFGGDDGVGCILTADTLIAPKELFQQQLADAIAVASEANAIVTMGLEPTRPDTGFGYIECGDVYDTSPVKITTFSKVARFVEKPDLETAKQYLESGKYLWNAGMFIWKASVMREAFQHYAPDIAPLIDEVAVAEDMSAVLSEAYPTIRSISVDFAVMEQAENIMVAKATFDWDDVGSWAAVEKHFPVDEQGNVTIGKCCLKDCCGVTAVNRAGENGVLAVAGLSNSVVVRTPSATLVCSKEESNKLKALLAQMKNVLLVALMMTLSCMAFTGFAEDVTAANDMRAEFSREFANPANVPQFDVRSLGRKPWVENRITRGYFSPIKRPPFYRDELTDDIDYYPEAYLERLAREGINGLWLTVELRNFLSDAEAPKRVAKLNGIVERCARHGIKVWPFMIEPRTEPKRFMHEIAGHCPCDPAEMEKLETDVRNLFTLVPGLAGIINISNGERFTTCLSSLNPVEGARVKTCERCAKKEPWELHNLTSAAFLRGMRAVNPEARFLSWFYQPQVPAKRAPWVAECARHTIDGVTFLYNFESGCEKEQLGKVRHGGDYWLSCIGPANGFNAAAKAASEGHARLGAKIQVGCSHECATVPYVPVPGLLYRKYAAMKACGVKDVMQCWYFGNCPGVMNRAAGILSLEGVPPTEEEFLLELAKIDWGDEATTMAKIWKDLSDAYAEYPLSNDIQYYGPFHAGIVWPLHAKVEFHQLARTWKPDWPSGDAIGECLENHTLEEAVTLSSLMREKSVKLLPEIARLEKKFVSDHAKIQDLAVIRTLAMLFESASDIFSFYLSRVRAIEASRDHSDCAAALVETAKMRQLALREREISLTMSELCRKDCRLGYHSEAEIHQFNAERLVWRASDITRTLNELDEIDAALRRGEPYLKSDFEREAPTLVLGEEFKNDVMKFKIVQQDGKLLITGDYCKSVEGGVAVWCFDRFCTTFEKHISIPYGKFSVELPANTEWIKVGGYYDPFWPKGRICEDERLNIGCYVPRDYGRIVKYQVK